MTEAARRRMCSGDWYCCLDTEFEDLRRAARRAVHAHNHMAPDERGDCAPELRNLFAKFGADARIEAPFHCIYGVNTELDERVYLNFGVTILDSGRVRIGARSMLGPGVQIYCADHHPDPEQRGQGIERAQPVTLGRDVWIGGGAVLLLGAEIGDGAIVGAGAVVRGRVAAGARVAGVPARPIGPSGDRE